MVLKKICVHRKTVSAHLGICCHHAQVPGSVVRLCHDGPVKQGVLCGYGIRGTPDSPPDCFQRAGNQGQSTGNQSFEADILPRSASVHYST